MNHEEFRLLSDPFDAREPTAIERMKAPTLDEWTAAIETLKSKESHADWWQRNGFAMQQQQYAQSYGYGLNQQNAGQYASQYQANLLAQLLGQQNTPKEPRP